MKKRPGSSAGARAFGVKQMKYCVSYKVNTDILHDADEIRFSSFNEIFPLREEEWF
jgi:hypothetical protein